MARKYARDNRGRFASKGSGATTRGGRLKTASGNKRQGQTMQAKGGRAGTIGKPRGLKPGALKPKAAAPVNRAGQASRGLARASKSAMESRRLQATGGAFKSPAARAKIDRTNKIAADAQAFYSTGKGSNSAAKRRETNSIRKGNRIAITDADRRQRVQALATAERKLAEMKRSGTGINKLTGSDSMLKVQQAHVDALRKPLGSSRKVNRSAEAAANRDALARRRSERRNSQVMAEVGRIKRANRNYMAAMAREGDGPNSKASRSASVAKRAREIYAGKVDPKAKTKARLTRSSDQEALRRRIKKQKDNTSAARPAAKPAGKPKPLTGVNQTVGRNLAGFKGLPVSLRSRKQAASAQAARRRNLLSNNAVSTGGTFKRGVNRQPNLLTGRVDRVGAGKFRPVAKRRR